MSNSLWPHGLYPTRLLSPWNSPGKDTGVGSHCLLQGIFPTQGSNPGLPHCRHIHVSALHPFLWLNNIPSQKTKIMASGPITSWEIDGETVETVSDFIFGCSKITADSDCSHEIKRDLLLGRKVMTNLDGILKSRDITLPTKVRLVKAMVFPVVWKWELDCEETWTPKNWCFWTMVLEKTLESPWTARRSN